MTTETTNPILAQVNKEEGASNPSTVETSDNLANLQKAIADQRSSTKDAVATELQGIASANTASDIMLKSMQQVTAASKTIALTKDNAALEVQNNNLSVMEAAGGNEMQVQLMSDLTEDIKKVNDLQARQADIVDDEHTGNTFFDSIINTFRHQGVTHQLNQARREQATTATQIQQLTQSGESFARINAINKQSINEGTILANQQLIQAQGDVELSKAQLAVIHNNSAAMSKVQAMRGEEVRNLTAAYRLEGEAESRKIQQEANKLRKEEAIYNREVWKSNAAKSAVDLEAKKLALETAKATTPTQITALKTKQANLVKATKEAETLKVDLTSQVRTGAEVSGVPQEPESTILWGLQQSGETGRRYAKLQEIGATGTLGGTPAEANKSLRLISPNGAFKKTKATNFLQEVTRLQGQAHTQAAATGVRVPTKPEDLDAEFNSLADTFLATKAVNIATGDTTNPFLAPPFTVLAQSKNVQETALYQKVLKVKGMKETNPQTIVDSALAGVASKTITIEEAADGIEAIFDQAAANNNEHQNGFKRIGLPPQSTYVTQLQAPPTFFDSLSGNVKSVLSLLPDPVISGLAAADTTFGEPDAAPLTYMSVDLMNGSKVREALVKLMSSTKAAEPAATTVSNP